MADANPERQLGHEPVVNPSGFYGPNTPGGQRGTTSDCWQHSNRLKSFTPKAQSLRLEGWTHTCIFPLGEGQI